MSNDAAKSQMADLIDSVQDHIQALTRAHQERALLTATVTACDKRIHVTANADGVPIEIRFADDIADLSYTEIAAATTEAAQAAAAKVQAEAEQLFAPLQQARTRLPRLSEIVPELPDLREIIPQAQPAPTAPPSRRSATDTAEFGGAEYVRRGRRSAIADEESW